MHLEHVLRLFVASVSELLYLEAPRASCSHVQTQTNGA